MTYFVQRVSHSEYGQGSVNQVRYSGYELLVVFDSGISKWLKKQDLRFEKIIDQEPNRAVPVKVEPEPVEPEPVEPEPVEPEPVVSVPALKAATKSFESRKLIEALRFGIAPHQYCDKFTFGRNSEIKEIKSWLEDVPSGSLIIKGAYGSGKSHLLDYIYSYSLNTGWAVARVEVDPSDAPFYKPKRIFESIIKSLSYINDNELHYFENLLDVIKNRKEITHDDRSLLGEFLRYRNYDYWTVEELLSLLQNYAFDDYSSTANMCCNMVSSIGWAFKKIIGLKGLLILFDEAELINYNYYHYQEQKSINLLKGLIFMSNNKRSLLSEDIRQTYQTKGYFGKETGLQYYGRNTGVRYLAKFPCYTKTIFAFVPSYVLDHSFVSEQQIISIDEISKKHLIKLMRYISDQYMSAFNSKLDFPLFDDMPTDHTRSFIKAVVESLDIQRHAKQ